MLPFRYSHTIVNGLRPARRKRSTKADPYLSDWLAGKRHAVKRSTHRCYVDSLRRVRQRYGHLALQDLGEAHVQAILTDMRTGKARKIRV